MEMRLFKNWWLMSIKGFLAIAFGLVMLILHYSLIKSSIAVIFGFLVLISGILIVSGALLNSKSNPRWRWWLMEGLVDILVGGVFIFQPALAKAFFLFLLAIWSFSSGCIQLVTSFRMQTYMQRWWIMIITGVFSILFAVLIFINPFYANYNLGTIVGVACVIFGLVNFYISRLLRNIYL